MAEKFSEISARSMGVPDQNCLLEKSCLRKEWPDSSNTLFSHWLGLAYEKNDFKMNAVVGPKEQQLEEVCQLCSCSRSF